MKLQQVGQHQNLSFKRTKDLRKDPIEQYISEVINLLFENLIHIEMPRGSNFFLFFIVCGLLHAKFISFVLFCTIFLYREKYCNKKNEETKKLEMHGK